MLGNIKINQWAVYLLDVFNSSIQLQLENDTMCQKLTLYDSDLQAQRFMAMVCVLATSTVS